MKEGYVSENVPAQGDMEKINQYTRRPFAEDEVFVFSMVLCDNQVDRDGERFPVASLEKLKELFLGKTCIFDHERSSHNQAARIFDTALEEVPGEMVEGEPLTRLTARAYLPRMKGTEEMIALIDSGMLKEVSVSCAVDRKVCSVCGQEECGHDAPRLLLDPTDAYECSFVAVPAQKGAGVTKHYGEKQWRALEEEARWGRQYREELMKAALKYSALVQPELPREVMKSAVKGLSVQELSAMARTYERMAQKSLPLKPQLAVEKEQAPDARHGEYKI